MRSARSGKAPKAAASQVTQLGGGYADAKRGRLDRVARVEEALAMNRRIGDLGNEPLLLAGLVWAHRARAAYAGGRGGPAGVRASAGARPRVR
ncbi:MAG: hypothetical protein ACRDHU_03510 [Actinomycetota bacterium]